MTELKAIEKRKLERLFQMEGGYVLDFSDRTMGDFFIDEFEIDIYDEKYEYGSGSKANRMRGFWAEESAPRVARTILALIDYREFQLGDSVDAETALVVDCRAIAERLTRTGVAVAVVSSGVLSPLSHEFIDEQVLKCRRKMEEGDHAGAVTNARTMVEAVLLGLEEKLFDSAENHKGDLLKQYKRVRAELNLDAGRSELADPLRQVLSGLTSIVNGLSALRNRASDAHATRYRTREHHARVAMNAAMTVTEFLLATYEYQRAES